ncbi:MAG: tetratricopeptide repeat protein [Acidobacteriaceae bacterium]|nr:tetratricopeptide repeat protein [Acidobacteriaceae bacterium]
MRTLITLALAVWLPAFAQPDQTTDLQSLLAEAHEAQTRNDFHAAADAYARAAAIRPDVAELWSNLGLMQYESYQYAQAQAAFRRALAINKSLFVPNLFLGLDLLQVKRAREATAYLLAAEKLNPQDTQTLLGLGRAFHMSGDPARSRDSYQRAADLAPDNGDAWYGLGIAYFALAESAAAKLTSSFAESPYVAKLKAEAHATDGGDDRVVCEGPQKMACEAFHAGDFRAAALAADQLVQQYPNDAKGWYWSVRAYQKLGVTALARAGELEPQSPKMHALLGDAYQQQRMFREAEDEYSKMLSLKPDNIAGLAGLAAAYLHDGRFNEARATASKALALDPQDSEINLLMGEILIAQHEYPDAESYLKRSLHARPDLLPRVHALLGRVYARTGRTKEAITELKQGLSSDEDGSVYYQLARLYQENGDMKAAEAAFQKSQRIRANRDVLAQANLAPVP